METGRKNSSVINDEAYILQAELLSAESRVLRAQITSGRAKWKRVRTQPMAVHALLSPLRVRYNATRDRRFSYRVRNSKPKLRNKISKGLTNKTNG